jgi:hypothetical protein
MKEVNGLAILARREALTEQEWQSLVEVRLKMIKPHFRDMTLKTLGDIQMIHDYFGTHDLKRDEPEVNEGKFGLATRGIFPNDDSWSGVASAEYHRGGDDSVIATTYKLWGLTRDGEWIKIEVYSTTSQEPYKYEGRTEKVQRVKTIKIEPSTLAEICLYCNCSSQNIWKRLGEIVKKWVEHRKSLYESARDLEEEILQEEAVFELVPKG